MILVLVPRTDLTSAERAAEFQARIWEFVRPCQAWDSCLKIDFTDAWLAVPEALPYPRLRIYLRPRVFAAVTPFAEPDIYSKAIEGTYFIIVWCLGVCKRVCRLRMQLHEIEL